MNKCRVCGNDQENLTFRIREMMFGLREEFEYFQCSECGCIQIVSVPEDLARHYSEGYYSMQLPPRGLVTRFLKRQRALYALHGSNPVGQLLVRRFGTPEFPDWLRRANVTARDAILDVGCGSGLILLEMRDAGFTNLTGIDPYVEQDIYYPNGVNILKKGIDEIEQQYDFVMFHHVFEHVPDPLETLKHIHRILKSGRMAIIRIPVADSYAWRHYGTDWVQLDAPRHLFIHSQRSMELLAKKAGFRIREVVYDSGEYQFWGSELCRMDIPISDPRAANGAAGIFSQDQMKDFRRHADELNRAGEGDAAAFYLEPV